MTTEYFFSFLLMFFTFPGLPLRDLHQSKFFSSLVTKENIGYGILTLSIVSLGEYGDWKSTIKTFAHNQLTLTKNDFKMKTLKLSFTLVK